MRKTKIVATLGPATNDVETIKRLINAGLNTARINFSHGNFDSHTDVVNNLKAAREEMGAPVALLLDTKGPEIRIRTFKDGDISLKKGQKFTLTTDDVDGDINIVSVTYEELPNDVQVGSKILLDDGLIELRVSAVIGNNIECIVGNDGELGNNKGVNLPETHVSLPSLTQKDIDDIKYGIRMGFDFIAASFVRTAKDVLEIRQVLEKNDGSHLQIVAKIENREGVENLESILEVADGIMVARGDMGVEIPPEEVPLIQKWMIEKCNMAGKPVITATQMLESMINNPRPTRAEANDVANAIFDGTDAIMLSGETAKGNYPVEAVKMMDRIARQVESSEEYAQAMRQHGDKGVVNVTNAITYATHTIAADLNAACIVTVTKSGYSGRMVAKYRPNCTILVVATNETVWRQMSLVWGVVAVTTGMVDSDDELFEVAGKCAMDTGLAKNGDLIVIVAGVPVGVAGTTNLVKVQVVGHVLVKGRGNSTGLGRVIGRTAVIRPSEDAGRRFRDGDILVASQTNDSMMDYVRKAGAVVVGTDQNLSQTHAEIACKALRKPLIVCTERVIDLIHSGVTVTIDCEEGFVYNGTLGIDKSNE
ncbi:MAG: pyruvate kinase [Defluviitaleaceae bacterium]|nr:pyruvate kinase [Defluviitaleaceae bacterium]